MSLNGRPIDASARPPNSARNLKVRFARWARRWLGHPIPFPVIALILGAIIAVAYTIQMSIHNSGVRFSAVSELWPIGAVAIAFLLVWIGYRSTPVKEAGRESGSSEADLKHARTVKRLADVASVCLLALFLLVLRAYDHDRVALDVYEAVVRSRNFPLDAVRIEGELPTQEFIARFPDYYRSNAAGAQSAGSGIAATRGEAVLHISIVKWSLLNDEVHVSAGEVRGPKDGKGTTYVLQRFHGHWIIVGTTGGVWIS